MDIFDFDSLRATPVSNDPFTHIVLPRFIKPAALAEVVAALPVMRARGSFPVGALSLKPAAKEMVAGLEGATFRSLIAEKFGLELDGAPVMTTLRGNSGEKDGQIHTDSVAKRVTILLYLNPANGDPARFAAWPLPVLADAPDHAGKGPLAGLAAGLIWAQKIGATTLLTVPVDTPFAPTDLLAALSPAPAVAVYGGRQHHLVAHWPVALRPQLENFLSRPGAYRVRDVLDLCAARQVNFTGPFDPFLNINTQDDLAAARQAQKDYFL